MKDINTDNKMTKAVMGALEDYAETKKALDGFAQVPFMKRELTKRERREQYDRMTLTDIQQLNAQMGPDAVIRMIQRHGARRKR